MSDLVEGSLARERLVVFILGAFALIALLLAGVGVFGVLANEVTRRRKEIGIRLALGARDAGIVVMLLGQALRRVVVGVGAGMLLAALLARGMQSLLFGVGATDSLSFVGVSTIVIVLALIATLIPARRALRVSPLRSLREE